MIPIRNLRVWELDAASGGDRAAFVRFPYRLYKGDRYWAGMGVGWEKTWLDPPRHPEREHLQIAYFMAEALVSRHVGAGGMGPMPVGDVQTVGRIGVWIDPLERRKNPLQLPTGRFFGLEFINADEVPERLVDSAWEWLIRRGARKMVGPVGAFGWGDAGVLIDGFNIPPTVFAPYHMPYYADLIRAAGLSRAETTTVYRVTLQELSPPVATGLRLRPAELGEWQAIFLQLTGLQHALGWDIAGASEAEEKQLAHQLQPFILPQLLAIAEHRDTGQLAGVAIAVPDYNQIWRRTRGQRLPLGWLKERWYRRGMRSARLLALGIEESDDRDIVRALLEATVQQCLQSGYIHLDLSLNDAQYKALAPLLAEHEVRAIHRYQVFERGG